MKKFELTLNEAREIIESVLPGQDWVDRAAMWEDFGCVWDGDAIDLYHEAMDVIEASKEITVGLCKGRHEIPQVKDYIFDAIEDVTAFMKMEAQVNRKVPYGTTRVNLYVTGLTAAAMAVVSVCARREIPLVCYHYDKETGEYLPQRVLNG